jgi:hypothetical protein
MPINIDPGVLLSIIIDKPHPLIHHYLLSLFLSARKERRQKGTCYTCDGIIGLMSNSRGALVCESESGKHSTDITLNKILKEDWTTKECFNRKGRTSGTNP